MHWNKDKRIISIIINMHQTAQLITAAGGKLLVLVITASELVSVQNGLKHFLQPLNEFVNFEIHKLT